MNRRMLAFCLQCRSTNDCYCHAFSPITGEPENEGFCVLCGTQEVSARHHPVLTASQRRALEIVRDRGDEFGYGLTPGHFAKYMWPESPGWEVNARMGRGTHKGAGMYGAGGAYLGRLKRLGLIADLRGPHGRRRNARIGFGLTKKGRKALEDVR